uniref:Uncharacterized protein n=1 Tax=Glossina palpalis gambiensis TaxID=67801 RepID=A0A1B0BK55_9MUSC
MNAAIRNETDMLEERKRLNGFIGLLKAMLFAFCNNNYSVIKYEPAALICFIFTLCTETFNASYIRVENTFPASVAKSSNDKNYMISSGLQLHLSSIFKTNVEN